VAGFATVRLADIAEVKGGKRLPVDANLVTTPTSHPYIRGRDIRDGKITFDDPVYVLDEDFERIKRYTVDSGDVCVTIVGNIGDIGITPPSLHRASLTENAVKLVNLRDDIDARFLMYALLTQDAQSQMKLSAAGAAQPKLGIYKVNEIKIPAPPLEIQCRISGILSAYDQLIENSQRRIKILESMARALYREWFVHFRFPGHESTPLIPSPLGEIPQGWEVTTVADAFVISGGGTPSRKEEAFWEGGTIQWYSPSDLTGAGTMFMDDSSDHITKAGLAESSARLFPSRSVMLTSRATIGAIAINTHEACTNQGFITCLPNERVPLYFLFHWVKENVPTFLRMASGATFKEISRGVFKSIEFLQPPANLVSHFEKAATPMGEEGLALQRQIQNLRRTRDLLLPRLLSGQIGALT
jgi:type I restriction enzyme, S subunit